MDSLIKAIINAYFNAFDFKNKWFLDFRTSLYVTKNK